MNTNKNSYTIIYSIVLVVLVAALLAIVATGLKDRQQQNIDMEKQSSILSAVGLTEGMDEAKDKIAFASEAYNKNIKAIIVNHKGEITSEDGKKAFEVDLAAMSKRIAKAANLEGQAKEDMLGSIELPVFICESQNARIYPIYGPGLWGPIWGYVAVKNDNSICGTTFDHKGETPGLGAKITEPFFSEKFTGRQIFCGDHIVTIVKNGKARENYEIDGISGATITSTSVGKAMGAWLELYKPYIDSLKLTVDNE